MASNLKTFDSLGGFSVENTTLISEDKDLLNVNTFELKNSFFSDSTTSQYILRGTTTAVLSLDDVGTQISLPSNSINFVTANIVGVRGTTGTGHLSLKLESVVNVDSSGGVDELSNLRTILKDSIPTGETWSVEFFDTGANNRMSYSVSKQGGTAGQVIKWVAYVQVVSIDWT